MEYIKANSRNWGFRGDVGTWAGIETKKNGKRYFVAKRARFGIISSSYEEEMTQICAEYGVDFTAIRCGDSAKAEIA